MLGVIHKGRHGKCNGDSCELTEKNMDMGVRSLSDDGIRGLIRPSLGMDVLIFGTKLKRKEGRPSLVL